MTHIFGQSDNRLTFSEEYMRDLIAHAVKAACNFQEKAFLAALSDVALKNLIEVCIEERNKRHNKKVRVVDYCNKCKTPEYDLPLVSYDGECVECLNGEISRLRGRIKSWVSKIGEEYRYGGKPSCFGDMMTEAEK